MQAHCTNCKSPLAESSIDREREIATCGACGRLVDLRPQLAAAQNATPSRPRMRPPVALPAGMEVSRSEAKSPGGYRQQEDRGSVLITRRWLRPKHYVMLVVFVLLAGVLVHFWTKNGASGWLVLATAFVASWNYMLLGMFLNRTRIRADASEITVTHGPVPLPLGKSRRLSAGEVRQLFAMPSGGHFAVGAHVTDGTTVALISPLVTAEQALFVEQELEKVLGLVDYEVAGELASAVPVAGGKTGSRAGIATAALGPVIAAIAVGTFLLVARTEVSGTLTTRGSLGERTYTPDDCTSGQRSGFSGVELTSKADDERVVRLARDPTRGNLLIVEARGASRPEAVIDSKACKQFEIRVDRTSTTINDIVVLEGDANLDCPEISGHVTFAGCH
jgi:hypothetical protein